MNRLRFWWECLHNYWYRRCFFCGERHFHDNLHFSWEWDAYFHMACYKKAVESSSNPMHIEATMMQEEVEMMNN